MEVSDKPLVVKAKSLNGHAVVDEKPGRGIRFELHKAITFNREEGKRRGLWEPQILRTATSDASGLFTFGEVSPGRYWLVQSKGPMDFRIEVGDSYGRPPYKRLLYSYFGDGCEGLNVEDVH
jgi:hypothetical protein